MLPGLEPGLAPAVTPTMNAGDGGPCGGPPALPILRDEKHVQKEASLCVALGTQAWASGRAGMALCLGGRGHGSPSLAGEGGPY